MTPGPDSLDVSKLESSLHKTGNENCVTGMVIAGTCNDDVGISPSSRKIDEKKSFSNSIWVAGVKVVSPLYYMF